MLFKYTPQNKSRIHSEYTQENASYGIQIQESKYNTPLIHFTKYTLGYTPKLLIHPIYKINILNTPIYKPSILNTPIYKPNILYTPIIQAIPNKPYIYTPDANETPPSFLCDKRQVYFCFILPIPFSPQRRDRARKRGAFKRLCFRQRRRYR